MLSVSNTNTDMQNVYTLDTVRLDKVVKALMFVSNHIRQTGDIELANRIETAVYEVLLSAYKDRFAFAHISNYVSALLSMAIAKDYMSSNTIEIFRTGLQSVYSKRQDASDHAEQIKEILQMSVTNTETHTAQLAETDREVTSRTYSVKPLEIVKKDKVGISTNVRNADEKRQSSRRVEILRTLSATPVSIKDISMHVLGCSEKTIQRELNNLVDDGSVERVGEKRWSKYVLRR